MKYTDHEAIRRAYPQVSTVDEGLGCFTAQMVPVVISQSVVDEARVQLDAEAAAVKYKEDRKAEYPSWEDQLDKIYHSGINAWKADIKKIKDKYPKP